MKKLLFTVGLLTSGYFHAQTNAVHEYENLQKYWKFRNNFQEHFVKVGSEAGESLPAGSINPRACIDNDFNDDTPYDGSGGYSEMHWGDGMIRHGHYLGLLATEYRLLKNSGQDVTAVLSELYYALEAINRLDLRAEVDQAEFYNAEFSQNLNGFYLREDVGEDFATNNWGSTSLKMRCTNSAFYRNNNVMKENNPPELFNEGNSYQNVPSLDQMTSLMIGFLLIHKLVDNIYVQPTSADAGFQIVTETKAIVHRIVSYARDHNWFLIDVNGWPVANNGGNLFLLGYPIAVAAQRMTGVNYLTDIHRRIISYQNIQDCMTGYSTGHQLSSAEQFAACLELTTQQQLVTNGDLSGAEQAGPLNNQDISRFQIWQAGGPVTISQPIEHDFWFDPLPAVYQWLYDDWEDDHKFNTTLGYSIISAIGLIEFDKFPGWANKTILFNGGVMLGIWSQPLVDSWASNTGNYELALVNSVLYNTATVLPSTFYRAFLDSMSLDGAYNMKGVSGTYADYLKHPNGWASEYRWTYGEDAYNGGAVEGMYSNLDYMLYHNLYRLKFNTSFHTMEQEACDCDPVSKAIDPNQNTAQQAATTDLNVRLAFLGFCEDVFAPVNQSVTGIFDVQPHFPDYMDKGIFTTKIENTDASIENGGEVRVKTKFIICGSTLDVKTGGELIIDHQTFVNGGALIENSGDIVIKNGAQLIVRGSLHLHNQSTLTIEEGGELLIDNVTGIGTLVYDAGATISMLGSGASFVAKGYLKTHGNTEFKVQHPNATSGRIWLYGTSFEAEAGSGKFLFKGKGINDNFLTLSGQINNFSTHVANITFRDCKITYEPNTHLEMKRPVSFIRTVNEATDAINGITVYSDNTFSFSEFYNVPIVANLNYFGTDEFYANDCTFEFNDDIEHPYGGNLITITGQNYNISNSVFNGRGAKCIDASLGIYPSSVTGCTFTHYDNTNVLNTLIGINDHSNVELKVKNSGFSNLFCGLSKVSGKLSLRCNNFSGNRYHNVVATTGATLNMTSDDNKNGYNQFQLPTESSSIEIDASKITLNNGYNYIHTGTDPVIVGTTNTYGYPGLYNPLLAKRNQWASGASVPPATTFDLTTANGYGIDVDASSPELMPACGYHDGDPGPIKGKSLATDNDGMAIIAFQGDSVRLDSAIYDAMSYLTAYNSAGNDFEVISRLNETLNQNELDVNDPVYGDLIPFAIQQMKLALESLYRSGQLNADMNAGAYETNTQHYADALVLLNSVAVDGTNYRKQFYHEMDKVQLFRMLDRHDISVEIMQNLEACGLDFAEQQYLNSVKESTLREIELQALVLADSTVAFDSIPVDTASFQTPVITSQSTFSFGADISDLNNILYPNCEYYSMKSNGEQQNDMQVFPNPNGGAFVVKLKKDKMTKAVLFDSNGKQVAVFTNLSGHTLKVDMELVPGMYLLEVTDEHGKASRERVVVQ